MTPDEQKRLEKLRGWAKKAPDEIWQFVFECLDAETARADAAEKRHEVARRHLIRALDLRGELAADEPIREQRDDARAELADVEAEVERLEQWVNDLQAGMYINCVYCGHRYGPDDEVPSTMADALKQHVEQCTKHPMSALKKEVERLRDANEGLHAAITALEQDHG